jgi:hypothetical protein
MPTSRIARKRITSRGTNKGIARFVAIRPIAAAVAGKRSTIAEGGAVVLNVGSRCVEAADVLDSDQLYRGMIGDTEAVG